MKGYVYVVTRDFGFAPNPFYRFLTLATCKAGIRKSAEIGDWVFGLTPRSLNNKLIYAMEVNQKITYDEYWEQEEYNCKKPIFNGSLKQMYGDNIYHRLEDGTWMQENSHHSNVDGTINNVNLNRDTKSDKVLISYKYFYFGRKYIEFPEDITIGRHYKIIRDNNTLNKLVNWLQTNYDYGYYDDPIRFDSFIRYGGIS